MPPALLLKLTGDDTVAATLTRRDGDMLAAPLLLGDAVAATPPRRCAGIDCEADAIAGSAKWSELYSLTKLLLGRSVNDRDECAA
jgi:hypothetical protein